MEVIYRESCPSCGGDIQRTRLLYGLSCGNCDGESGLVKWMRELESEFDEFSRFISKEFGIEPISVQKT